VSRTEAAYSALIAAGELKPDADQAAAATRLGALEVELDRPVPGTLARLFGRTQPKPRGIYLWGAVGRGKSMLMDLFYGAVTAEPKRRVHFHAFMLDVHAALHRHRARRAEHPIHDTAREIAATARLLAFDELQVTNIADATILSRLFAVLLDEGVTVVATSNRPPRDLYKDGLSRELFVPFIELVERELDVVGLNGPTDYRLDRMAGMATWYVPNGEATTKALSSAFFRLTDYPPEDRAHVPSATIDVAGGRTLFVPKSLKGVAVFSFKRLCTEARGAADYLAVAQHYHTVIIVGIPVMGPEQRNEAARFVALVDALYEYRVKLLAGADAEPRALYPTGDGSFEFERTTSRLIEMQSADYLAEGHGLRAG
jgi:cell division protein ZapE